MKMFLFIFALTSLLFPVHGFGVNAIINCASTNIGQTYTTSFPQLALTTGLQVSHFLFENNSAGRVCAQTTTASSTSAPASNAGHEHCLEPYTMAILDGVDVPQNTKNVYLRGDAATCTSGAVDVDLY